MSFVGGDSGSKKQSNIVSKRLDTQIQLNNQRENCQLHDEQTSNNILHDQIKSDFPLPISFDIKHQKIDYSQSVKNMRPPLLINMVPKPLQKLNNKKPAYKKPTSVQSKVNSERNENSLISDLNQSRNSQYQPPPPGSPPKREQSRRGLEQIDENLSEYQSSNETNNRKTQKKKRRKPSKSNYSQSSDGVKSQSSLQTGKKRIKKNFNSKQAILEQENYSSDDSGDIDQNQLKQLLGSDSDSHCCSQCACQCDMDSKGSFKSDNDQNEGKYDFCSECADFAVIDSESDGYEVMNIQEIKNAYLEKKGLQRYAYGFTNSDSKSYEEDLGYDDSSYVSGQTFGQQFGNKSQSKTQGQTTSNARSRSGPNPPPPRAHYNTQQIPPPPPPGPGHKDRDSLKPHKDGLTDLRKPSAMQNLRKPSAMQDLRKPSSTQDLRKQSAFPTEHRKPSQAISTHSKDSKKSKNHDNQRKSRKTKGNLSLSAISEERGSKSQSRSKSKRNKSNKIGEQHKQTIDDIVKQNNLEYKRQKIAEQEQKLLERQQLKERLNKLKEYDAKIRKTNMDKIQEQQELGLKHEFFEINEQKQVQHKWGWGVNQYNLEAPVSPREKVDKSKLKYKQEVDIQQIFDYQQSDWLLNIKKQVKQEYKLRVSVSQEKDSPQKKKKQKDKQPKADQKSIDRQMEALRVLGLEKKKQKQQNIKKQEKLKLLNEERLSILEKTKKKKFEPPDDMSLKFDALASIQNTEQPEELNISKDVSKIPPNTSKLDKSAQDKSIVMKKDADQKTNPQSKRASNQLKNELKPEKTNKTDKSDKQKFKGGTPRESVQKGQDQTPKTGQNPYYSTDHQNPQQLNPKEFSDFQKQYDVKQQQIEKIINSKNISLKGEPSLTSEEQRIASQLRFLAPDGRELPSDFVKQIFEDAEINDAPVLQVQQGFIQPGPDTMQEYHKQVENEIKKKLFQQRDQPMKQKQVRNNLPQSPPIELRKKAELQRAMNEVERLQNPDLKQIYKQPLMADDFGQNLGEFEGMKLKGMQPFWNELKVKGLQRARDEDSDSDVYVQERRKPGQFVPSAMKDERELLEKLETFNDKKMKQRVKKGQSKRIPLGDKPQNYDRVYREYKQTKQNNDLWDSEDEEIIMRNKNKDVDFDPIKDQVFELGSEDLFSKNFIDVE